MIQSIPSSLAIGSHGPALLSHPLAVSAGAMWHAQVWGAGTVCGYSTSVLPFGLPPRVQKSRDFPIGRVARHLANHSSPSLPDLQPMGRIGKLLRPLEKHCSSEIPPHASIMDVSYLRTGFLTRCTGSGAWTSSYSRFAPNCEPRHPLQLDLDCSTSHCLPPVHSAVELPAFNARFQPDNHLSPRQHIPPSRPARPHAGASPSRQSLTARRLSFLTLASV